MVVPVPRDPLSLVRVLVSPATRSAIGDALEAVGQHCLAKSLSWHSQPTFVNQHTIEDFQIVRQQIFIADQGLSGLQP